MKRTRLPFANLPQIRLPLVGLALSLGLASCSSLDRAEQPGAFSPAQLDETARVTRIGVGSCADQKDPEPIWTVIGKDNPDLFLFIGDNVYGDSKYNEDGSYAGSDPSPERLRMAYEKLMTVEPFTRFWQKIPILPIWDDHDYGQNDGGRDYENKFDSEEQFETFWHLEADHPARQHAGVYYEKTIGKPGERVQILFLDTRFFRSGLTRPEVQPDRLGRYVPSTDPAQDMLGPEQWAWLESKLKEPADLRLLVSSIQVIADGHRWERWGNMPRERQKLYDLIKSTGAEDVILISGDRHQGALYEYDAGLGYPLYELTTSSLNRSFGGSDEPGPHRLGDLFGPENYAIVDVDWNNRIVRLDLKDNQGVVVRTLSVSLDALNATR